MRIHSATSDKLIREGQITEKFQLCELSPYYIINPKQEVRRLRTRLS